MYCLTIIISNLLRGIKLKDKFDYYCREYIDSQLVMPTSIRSMQDTL